MQEKDGTCYLCRLLCGDGSQKATQEHHAIYGRGRRKLSEHYGLKVCLCLPHHTAGPAAVHNSPAAAGIVKRAAQAAFEERYSRERFMEVFGKNYLGGAAGESPPAAGPGNPGSRINTKAGTGFVPPGFRWLTGGQGEGKDEKEDIPFT